MVEQSFGLRGSIENLGFYYDPKDSRQLQVALRSVPTYKHFDPERINFSAKRGGRLERVSYTNATFPTERSFQEVALGLVTIADRVDSRLSFWTFGGALEVVNTGRESICTLTSGAPIFPTSPTIRDARSQFVEETIMLFARLFAERGHKNETTWQKLLTQYSANSLYNGVICSLSDKYSKEPILIRAYPDFYRHLVNKLLPQAADYPSLEALLTL